MTVTVTAGPGSTVAAVSPPPFRRTSGVATSTAVTPATAASQAVRRFLRLVATARWMRPARSGGGSPPPASPSSVGSRFSRSSMVHLRADDGLAEPGQPRDAWLLTLPRLQPSSRAISSSLRSST
ncbi:hypothetical protein ACFQ0B_27010 [Nonomuraea thailandensis]